MTTPTERDALEAKLLMAADAYDRIIEKADEMGAEGAGLAAALTFSMHGHLWREAANAILAAKHAAP